MRAPAVGMDQAPCEDGNQGAEAEQRKRVVHRHDGCGWRRHKGQRVQVVDGRQRGDDAAGRDVDYVDVARVGGGGTAGPADGVQPVVVRIEIAVVGNAGGDPGNSANRDCGTGAGVDRVKHRVIEQIQHVAAVEGQALLVGAYARIPDDAHRARDLVPENQVIVILGPAVELAIGIGCRDIYESTGTRADWRPRTRRPVDGQESGAEIEVAVGRRRIQGTRGVIVGQPVDLVADGTDGPDQRPGRGVDFHQGADAAQYRSVERGGGHRHRPQEQRDHRGRRLQHVMAHWFSRSGRHRLDRLDWKSVRRRHSPPFDLAQ